MTRSCLCLCAAKISRRPFFASFYILLLISACLQLQGCVTQPGKLGYSTDSLQNVPDNKIRARILRTALSAIGDRYRFGGAQPGGFDCSGLVYYSYTKAGFDVPRTTSELYGITKPVSLSKLLPGDLLFFRVNRRGISHVAIYQGNGVFIHAPISGKRVERDSLNAPYWSAHLVRGGRLI